MKMEKHFVTFYSPGTTTAESTTLPIDSWDTNEAVKMVDNVTERHGARPYGFRFSTRSRNNDELDSKVTRTSDMYFLGGEIRTINEVRAAAKLDERILLSNMECNGYKAIVTNRNSYSWTQPLQEGDVVLDYQPRT